MKSSAKALARCVLCVAGIVAVSGCAGTSDRSSDRSPEWTKQNVTGSRIKRPAGESTGPVRDAAVPDVRRMPGVAVRPATMPSPK